MDFSQFIDKLERFLVHTISVSAKIGHSKFWVFNFEILMKLT